MANEMFERGLEIRKSVLGKEFVEKSISSADDFNRPMQELVTEYCWGAIWGREGLSKKTRSMLNLAMLWPSTVPMSYACIWPGRFATA